MAGLELDLPRDTRLLAPGPVLGPLLREVEPDVDQGMFDPRDISHVDTDLAVLDLAEPAAPLPGDADRLVPLLGEGRGIEDDHPVRLAEPLPDFFGEGQERGSMVPVGLADEALHRLAILVEQVSDPLGGLVVQVGEQPGEVFGGAGLLVGPNEAQKGWTKVSSRSSRPRIASGETSA